MCTICLVLLGFNSYGAFSQQYKTILLEKEKKASGLVWHTDMPKSNPAFSLVTNKMNHKTWSTDDSVIRESNKVLLFKFNTSEFKSREVLFVNIITRNIYPLKHQSPLVYSNRTI